MLNRSIILNHTTPCCSSAALIPRLANLLQGSISSSGGSVRETLIVSPNPSCRYNKACEWNSLIHMALLKCQSIKKISVQKSRIRNSVNLISNVSILAKLKIMLRSHTFAFQKIAQTSQRLHEQKFYQHTV